MWKAANLRVRFPSPLPIQMNTRAKRLRVEAEEHALSLQNAFHVEMMKLPKSVRAMSLREFSDQYGEVGYRA